VLTGRSEECSRLDGLLEGARSSRGGALVIRGEAGVGKTALLDYAAGRDFRLLRGGGVQAESEFPYAAAHQLLQPLLPLVDELPAPQADAVRVALGMAPGGPPDRFLVALGFLSLLSEAAREQPLLCLLDDTQWCDGASTDALTFAARRLSADPVVVLFAVRDEPGADRFELPGVAELVVSGLSDRAGTELLTVEAGLAVPETVASVLVAHTRGNPLALVEVARALTSAELAGQQPLREPLPVGDRLESAFLARTSRLSAAAQHLLLLTAAEESGEEGIILGAAGHQREAEEALAEAARSGLLTCHHGVIRLCHPLVRSAVYGDATPSARRAVHRALAEQLAARGHLDRRAWHLAAATVGPDDELADELERLASRAEQRSGHGAASGGHERAADLSSSAGDRTRRMVAAASSAWMAGQAGRARDLVRRAEESVDEPGLRARLLHLQAWAALRNGELDLAFRVLREGADLVWAESPPQALEMLADAVDAAMYAGDGPRAQQAAERAAVLVPGDGTRQLFLSAWLAATSSALQGRTARSAELVRTALSLADDLDDPRLLTWAGTAAVQLGDIDTVRAYLRRAVASARNSGAVASLPYPLEKWAFTEALLGSYAAAGMAAEEGLRLAIETEQAGSAAHLHATLAYVAASRGDEEECERHGRAARDAARARGLGLPLAIATWAAGRLDLGLGRAESAFEHLSSMQDAEPGRGNPIIALWSTSDVVEAAVRVDRQGEVTGAVARLEAWAAATGQLAAVGAVGQCRALLGDPDAAERLVASAEAFREAHSPYEEARAELFLGELLRRRRLRSEARKHLRTAFVLFDRLGAHPWAGRAASELRATGEVVHQDGADGVQQLTSQELQIVRHVCQGATNRAVAAQLFISPRTVEYHLYKAYPKLGVSSRTQLVSQFGNDARLTGVH
jgi:DNA-binding CsgD family transcriptional regulator